MSKLQQLKKDSEVQRQKAVEAVKKLHDAQQSDALTKLKAAVNAMQEIEKGVKLSKETKAELRKLARYIAKPKSSGSSNQKMSKDGLEKAQAYLKKASKTKPVSKTDIEDHVDEKFSPSQWTNKKKYFDGLESVLKEGEPKKNTKYYLP